MCDRPLLSLLSLLIYLSLGSLEYVSVEVKDSSRLTNYSGIGGQSINNTCNDEQQCRLCIAQHVCLWTARALLCKTLWSSRPLRGFLWFNMWRILVRKFKTTPSYEPLDETAKRGRIFIIIFIIWIISQVIHHNKMAISSFITNHESRNMFDYTCSHLLDFDFHIHFLNYNDWWSKK